MPSASARRSKRSKRDVSATTNGAGDPDALHEPRSTVLVSSAAKSAESESPPVEQG
jgi:hypothetical protein